MSNGDYKPIGEATVGDMVKAVDSSGNLIDTEIVTIMHKHSNKTGKNKNKTKTAYFVIDNCVKF
jgi:hypothetical protein